MHPRRIASRLLPACVCLGLTACLPTAFPAATDAAPPGAATAPAAPMFTSLERGSHSGVTAAREVVVQDRAAFALLLEQVGVGRTPVATPPRVDFTTEMVVGVFLGTRRTGGYAAEILDLRLRGDTLVVRWQERRPAPGALVTQALTAPYHLVRTARHAGPVLFERAD